MSQSVLDLLQALIARPSVTPDDAGCQALLAERLMRLGFTCESVPSGPADAVVHNLWAKRAPRQAQPAGGATKMLVFAGHTDVVPTGPAEQWTSPPFEPTVRNGQLFGRGASDMKGSIAAYVVALEQYLGQNPDTPLTLGMLLTSDEEGPAVDGTVVVCRLLQHRGERLDYCLVGEPSSMQRCGDAVKNGRRGSLSARITVRGVQGHIAYPQLARNPIHELAPALAELAGTRWDSGNAHFPPTTWQVSNLHSGTGALNVIPGSVVLDCNFRFCTESTPQSLQQTLEGVLRRHGLDFDAEWTLAAKPFLCQPGALLRAVEDAIRAETEHTPELSTAGGTSDGRFLAELCREVIEFGPSNASIHKIDEYIPIADIEPLKNIYRRVLEKLAQ